MLRSLAWGTGAGLLLLAAVSSSAVPARAGAPIDAGCPLRGIVEGFYGPPWPTAARKAVLSFLGREGLNAYLYAPKDDVYQRRDWSQPYPAAQAAQLASLIAAAHRSHVRFFYSLSPGLSVTYSSARDVTLAAAKLEQVLRLGADGVVLSFDDIPGTLSAKDQAAFGSLGKAQATFVNRVLTRLWSRYPHLWAGMVPTEYFGTRPTPYWHDLATALDPRVTVFWTGAWVLDRTVTAAQARAAREALRHPLALWYNYPVNDFTAPPNLSPRTPSRLFLGPVQGLSPDLCSQLAAILANPMLQPYASELPLATLAAYLRDPSRYNPSAALAQAARELGGPGKSALWWLSQFSEPYFVQATSAGIRLSPGSPRLSAAVAAWEQAPSARNAAAVARLFSLMQDLPAGIRRLPQAGMRADLMPWAQVAALEGRAGLLALDWWQGRLSGSAKKQALASLRAAVSQVRRSPYNVARTAWLSFVGRAVPEAGSP